MKNIVTDQDVHVFQVLGRMYDYICDTSIPDTSTDEGFTRIVHTSHLRNDITEVMSTHIVYTSLNEKYNPTGDDDKLTAEGVNLSPEDEELFSKVNHFLFYGEDFGTIEEMTEAINKFLSL